MHGFSGLVVLLLVIGAIGAFWPYLVAVAVVAGLVWVIRRALLEEQAEAEAERERRAAVVARADQQHRWVMQGDLRGTYGEQRHPKPKPRPRPQPRRDQVVVVRCGHGVTVTVAVY